ncbi:hypothetical protein BH09GEM1_BH09GEM1_16170 [soil metagenome]
MVSYREKRITIDCKVCRTPGDSVGLHDVARRGNVPLNVDRNDMSVHMCDIAASKEEGHTIHAVACLHSPCE